MNKVQDSSLALG